MAKKNLSPWVPLAVGLALFMLVSGVFWTSRAMPDGSPGLLQSLMHVVGIGGWGGPEGGVSQSSGSASVSLGQTGSAEQTLGINGGNSLGGNPLNTSAGAAGQAGGNSVSRASNSSEAAGNNSSAASQTNTSQQTAANANPSGTSTETNSGNAGQENNDSAGTNTPTGEENSGGNNPADNSQNDTGSNNGGSGAGSILNPGDNSGNNPGNSGGGAGSIFNNPGQSPVINSGPTTCTQGCYPGCVPGCDPQCTPGCLLGNITPSQSSAIVNMMPTDEQVAQSVADQNQRAQLLAALIAQDQVLTTQVQQSAQDAKFQVINGDDIKPPDTTPAPDDLVQKIKSGQLFQH